MITMPRYTTFFTHPTAVNNHDSCSSESITEKKVSFDPTVTIYSVSSYKDCTGVWYTGDEMDQFEDENNTIGRQMIQQEQEQSSSSSAAAAAAATTSDDGHYFQYSGSIAESEDCTTRGLERFRLTNSSSICKAMGQRSRQTVLEEQDKQRLHQLYNSSSSSSSFTDYDDSDLYVADAYMFLAAPSKREAHHRALCDAQTVWNMDDKEREEEEEEASRKLLFLTRGDSSRHSKEQYLVRRSGPIQNLKVASVAA